MIITADMERVDEQIRPGEESAENVAENHVYKHIHKHVLGQQKKGCCCRDNCYCNEPKGRRG